ncbi:hypothetical protein M0G43_11075 [Subsaxibacter sp. CAU 1640]|uniref:hypothetical protein n=1 Tax=Subsaxibacter sp. CAU 1640 TaxID=2933271 RepID=UPI0020056FA3|nr:hypothetical protein [Subsaxibacter sp. CAU 1640]MCK7591117.1 hypothetical protein [Subsaxibacter sp. CAU 1640]
MKKLIFLISIMCVAFYSCDGRKSKSVSLKESIQEFNQKLSESPIIDYYPKEYTEIVTDTIISNKVKVRIKNFSLPYESISMSNSEKSNIKIQKHHRVFESEVIVSTQNKEILSTHISVEKFRELYPDDFWTNVTLQHVWVNQELSSPEMINLDMSFINPKSKAFKVYRMTIDGKGQQQIQLIEERA